MSADTFAMLHAMVQVRKLEFILAEAKARGHDSVITLGGVQSNHARATAVAARWVLFSSSLPFGQRWLSFRANSPCTTHLFLA